MEGDAVKNSRDAHFAGPTGAQLLLYVMIFCFVALLLLALLTLPGCAQHTAAPVDQPTQQAQAPISDQAAQGSNSHVWVYIQNAPSDNALPSESGGSGLILNLGEGGGPATLAEANSDGNGNGVRDTRAGYVQSGLTLNIQTGGSSAGPQSTGAVSGQASQPGATITQSPEQRPEAAVTVPVAVALPGGAASSSGGGATGQGTVTLSTQQQAELKTALLEALAGDENALARIAELLGMVSPAATTQPAED